MIRRLYYLLYTTLFFVSCVDKEKDRYSEEYWVADDRDQDDKDGNNEEIAIENNLTTNEILQQIKSIKQDEKWKLIIDGAEHKGGADVFDKPRDYSYFVDGVQYSSHKDGEQGYRESMLAALDFVLSPECMERKFDHNLLYEIHTKACDKVKSIDKKFRIGDVFFGLTTGNFSNAGKKNLKKNHNLHGNLIVYFGMLLKTILIKQVI